MTARTRLRIAAAALICAAATAYAWEVARAWEVVGGGPLPTFAAGPALNAAIADAPAAGADAPARNGWNPGYSFRLGRDFLVGVETRNGFTTTNPFAAAAGFESSGSSMKFGYDMGRFKPFVAASFSEIRPPAFGADPFTAAGAQSRLVSPFSAPARTSTVGAGFDYSITDKLSVGVSVSATQAGGGWAR